MVKNYKEINDLDKENIVEYYYKNKDIKMENIWKVLQISDRAIRRVLKEKGINTRRKNRYILNENYFW